jgi:methylmalonyl-CoA/ethylmalonyl-CoA epimerase
VSDPIQQARLCMVGLKGDPSAPIVELVQPSGDQSPTYRAGAKGGGWHHVCLILANTRDGDEFAGSQRMLPVTPWQPAVLFDGRPVRFFYSRNRELIELISDERVSETTG